MPTGPEDSPATYNDGRVGAALIQEFRFAEMCKRIQRSISKKFDEEFKLYLKKRDINIDSSSFNLGFVEPQSFVAWRQIELDSSRINSFNQMTPNPFFSKRWLMERYLGLTKDEINQNHEMLMEENPSKFKTVSNVNDIISGGSSPTDLRDVGFSKSDLDTASQAEQLPPEPENTENLPGTNTSNPQIPGASELGATTSQGQAPSAGTPPGAGI